MNIKQLIEKYLEQAIKEMLEDEDKKEPNSTTQKQMIGEWVIVRCRDAGVHYGKLVSYEGREVVLSDSRRMHYWKAAAGHSLSGCAVNGIDQKESRITAVIKTIVLPEACEIIFCEEKAIETIGGADEYHP